MSDPGSRPTNWKPPLAHPLVLLMLVTLVVRGLGLVRHTFGADLNGQPMVLVPWVFFPATFNYHYAVIMAGAAGALLVWRWAPRLRRGLVVVSGIAAAGVMLLGQADFLMLRLVGRRLTPEVLTTYANQGSWTVEIWAPLMADWGHSLWSLGLVVMGWLMLGGILWWSRQRSSEPRWSGPWWVGLTVGAIYLWSVPLHYQVMRVTMRPPEVVWAHSWWRAQHSPAKLGREDRMAVVRNVFFAQDADSGSSVGLGGVGSLPANTTPGSRPDIVVLVVESLRGATTGFVNGEEPSPTPVLDRLAGDGIAFSRFISNGFPSSEGFFALHTGLLPHPTRTATATFTGHHFDALPERLNRLGYYTTALWGGNPVMDNQLAWAQRWYDQVDYGLGANRWRYTKSRSDRETIEALIAHLHRGDQERPGQPQFIYAATAGMHEPFSAGEPDANYKMANRDGALPYDPVTMGDREVNYRERLREFDDALERLRVFLETRTRRDQTVLLVCGDHSVLLNEAVDLKMRTYPVDGFVWTGAVLHGAPSLIGPPRVADFPASQVDVMPTLLGLAGDSRATMTMGMDLLGGTELRERQAVAVREGGFRLDRMNGSLLVNAENPEDWQATPEGWPEAADQAQELYEAVWSWASLLEENQHGPSRGDREGDE